MWAIQWGPEGGGKQVLGRNCQLSFLGQDWSGEGDCEPRRKLERVISENASSKPVLLFLIFPPVCFICKWMVHLENWLALVVIKGTERMRSTSALTTVLQRSCPLPRGLRRRDTVLPRRASPWDVDTQDRQRPEKDTSSLRCPRQDGLAQNQWW